MSGRPSSFDLSSSQCTNTTTTRQSVAFVSVALRTRDAVLYDFFSTRAITTDRKNLWSSDSPVRFVVQQTELYVYLYVYIYKVRTTSVIIYVYIYICMYMYLCMYVYIQASLKVPLILISRNV